MILTGQEAIALEPTPQKDFALATVAGVHADGLSLRFAGEDAPTQKHYLCAGGCVFNAGQRVLAAKVSGEYVVLCTVGAPDTLLIANAVKNTETTYNPIQFKMVYTNELQYRINQNGAPWVKLKNQ